MAIKQMQAVFLFLGVIFLVSTFLPSKALAAPGYPKFDPNQAIPIPLPPYTTAYNGITYQWCAYVGGEYEDPGVCKNMTLDPKYWPDRLTTADGRQISVPGIAAMDFYYPRFGCYGPPEGAPGGRCGAPPVFDPDQAIPIPLPPLQPGDNTNNAVWCGYVGGYMRDYGCVNFKLPFEFWPRLKNGVVIPGPAAIPWYYPKYQNVCYGPPEGAPDGHQCGNSPTDTATMLIRTLNPMNPFRGNK